MMWLFLPFRNLFRNIRRTVAVLVTIGLGAGALLAFDGFIQGVLTQYRDDTIHAHYGNGQINTKGYRESVFSNPIKHWIDNGDELEEFLYEIDGVEHVFPRASFSAILKKGKITVAAAGQGIKADREADFFQSLNVEEGEMLHDGTQGILLGRGLAKSLDVKPGDTVTVVATSMKGLMKNDDFTVSGIFHTGLQDFDSRNFRIELGDAQRLLKTSKIELVSLGLRDLSDWENVAAKVNEVYPKLEAVPFDVLDEIYYKHSVSWLNAQFHIVQIIILSIVLFGIFNSISAAILERKQEIGNLRANGESVFQVMRLIMVEGVMLAIFGSCLGMGVAYSFLTTFIHEGILMPPGPGMTRQFYAHFSFEWPMVVSTLMLGVTSSTIASFLAGVRVARMPIAKLLRAY